VDVSTHVESVRARFDCMRPTSTPRRKIVSEESPVAGVAGAGVCPDAREAIANRSTGPAVQLRMESTSTD
jgi:hypothetical protein